MEAALKGAEEIGFTIMSISMSLVAVFIPLLLMGGIIGRLFREFAVTVTMTIVVSAFVALTLSPMMCALFLRDEKHARARPACTWRSSAASTGCCGIHARRSTSCCAISATLIVFLVTVAATVVLYVMIPRDSFPQQDTGIIPGLSDAPQDISFDEMVRLQHRLTDVVAHDPDVAELRHRPRRRTAGQQRFRGHRAQAAR